MKRSIIIIVSMAAILLFSGCASEVKEESSDKTSQASVQTSEGSDQVQLTKTESFFGGLYKQDEYSITADISVVSTASPDDVSRYALKIAADFRNNAAMMHITPSEGEKVHIIIKDGFSYNISEEQGTCTQQKFNDEISSFTSLYTTELYLGISENLELIESGSREVSPDGSSKKQKLFYEKFRLTGKDESSGADDVSITYYFDGDTPKTEVMETAAGNTTFVFKEISSKIKDRSIFDVDADVTSAAVTDQA